MSGVRRTYGVYTERWGWQPHAWCENGLPTFAWRTAPGGLLTRRQMREAGFAPGSAYPVGQIVCRRGRVRALLYAPDDLASKRVPSSAQLAAVGKALAARRWCPDCRTDVGYCIPTSVGRCIDCEFPPDRASRPRGGSRRADHRDRRPAARELKGGDQGMGIGAVILLSVLAAVVCGRAGSGGGVVLFAGLALVLFVSTPMGSGLPGAVLDFFAAFDDATAPTLGAGR